MCVEFARWLARKFENTNKHNILRHTGHTRNWDAVCKLYVEDLPVGVGVKIVIDIANDRGELIGEADAGSSKLAGPPKRKCIVTAGNAHNGGGGG